MADATSILIAQGATLNRWKTPYTFAARLHGREPCLGTCVTFTDPTVTEALTTVLDFVWIDAEHGPLSVDAVQGHIMATRGSQTTPLVRVAWNDPVLIKPILDAGAAGIIVPLIRTADEARRAVAACRYPPEGIRGYGPRRPGRYGTAGGPDYCRQANESIIVIVQIEHIDAVRNHRRDSRRRGADHAGDRFAGSGGFAGSSGRAAPSRSLAGHRHGHRRARERRAFRSAWHWEIARRSIASGTPRECSGSRSARIFCSCSRRRPTPSSEFVAAPRSDEGRAAAAGASSGPSRGATTPPPRRSRMTWSTMLAAAANSS